MFLAPLKYLSPFKCKWCICLEFIWFFSVSTFPCAAAEGINEQMGGGRWKGGEAGRFIKNTSLSAFAKTDLLRAAVVCTVVGTLV